MINKTSKKKIFLIFILISISSCVPWFSDNRFERNAIRYSFSLGLAGYNDASFCIKHNPNFTGKYQNGVRLSKTCIKYQYYTCHITHYCPNLPTEAERKKCEQDANDYWLKPWRDAKTGQLLDKAIATKEICESEASKNSQSKN